MACNTWFLVVLSFARAKKPTNRDNVTMCNQSSKYDTSSKKDTLGIACPNPVRDDMQYQEYLSYLRYHYSTSTSWYHVTDLTVPLVPGLTVTSVTHDTYVTWYQDT